MHEPKVPSRIVVVEDDPSMSQAIQRMLSAGGFAPTVYSSAEAALADGDASDADCLVLDIQLPGMSGLDLYQQLRMGGAEPPAIFVTAHDEPAIRRKASEIGARGFLAKPFSGRALLDAVSDSIGSG